MAIYLTKKNLSYLPLTSADFLLMNLES